MYRNRFPSTLFNDPVLHEHGLPWHALSVAGPSLLPSSKRVYMRNPDPDRDCITPKYRQKAPRDGTLGVELDFFHDLDATYDQILAHFDTAIIQLQPKARSIPRPPTRVQPERRGKRSLDAGDNIVTYLLLTSCKAAALRTVL